MTCIIVLLLYYSLTFSRIVKLLIVCGSNIENSYNLPSIYKNKKIYSKINSYIALRYNGITIEPIKHKILSGCAWKIKLQAQAFWWFIKIQRAIEIVSANWKKLMVPKKKKAKNLRKWSLPHECSKCMLQTKALICERNSKL